MTIKLFFSTDVHGSEKCYIKFLNAGKFYKAQVLVLGGDITGKVIVPLVKDSKGHYKATFRGVEREAKNEQEAQELEKVIRFSGYYPYRTDTDGMLKLQTDDQSVRSLFTQLMLDTVKRWVQLAEERLRDSGTKVYITGGNDDLPEIKPIIGASDYVVDPEDKVVDVDGKHEMISCGWSNPTPWKTPRESSEEELEKRIENMIAQHVKDMSNCIFNMHVPPIDSGLDTCPKLDANLKPEYAGGQPVMTVGGSSAVRKAIEKYQPLVGLHGHIHEAKGFIKIGRTLCLNPGSEYSEGILRGTLVELEDGSVKNFLLTQG